MQNCSADQRVTVAHWMCNWSNCAAACAIKLLLLFKESDRNITTLLPVMDAYPQQQMCGLCSKNWQLPIFCSLSDRGRMPWADCRPVIVTTLQIRWVAYCEFQALQKCLLKFGACEHWLKEHLSAEISGYFMHHNGALSIWKPKQAAHFWFKRTQQPQTPDILVSCRYTYLIRQNCLSYGKVCSVLPPMCIRTKVLACRSLLSVKWTMLPHSGSPAHPVLVAHCNVSHIRKDEIMRLVRSCNN